MKNRNMVFIEDDISVENALDMCPSERNESPTTILMNKSSKWYFCDDDEEHEEQVKVHLVAYNKAIEIPPENDDRIEGFNNDGRYP